MNETFLIADTHFDHDNKYGGIIKYCNRPFSCIDEMNETYVHDWNEDVKRGDKVIHVGDFAFRRAKFFFDQLNGEKLLIKGNHDKRRSGVLQLNWGWVKSDYGLTIGDTYSWLYHWPCWSWDRSFHGSFHFYGHVHEKTREWGRSANCGIDIWGKPVNFEVLRKHVENLPIIEA